MSARWIAGAVRSRCMAHRGLGVAGAQALAASASPAEAVGMLARSPYGRWVHPDDPPAAAARGLAESVLWNIRVLAGWLPPGGADTLRVLVGWFEISNVEGLLRELTGQPAEPPYRLGALATVWPRLAESSTVDELRAGLVASPWGDPGGPTPREIQLALRTAWAERVSALVPAARVWALGATVLLVAREQLAAATPLPAAAGSALDRLLGPGWSHAATLDELRAAVPTRARWSLAGIAAPDELWRAEAAWWHRVQTDATRLISASGFGPEQAVAAVGLLAVDGWRARAALAAASRGADAREVFDAVG